MKILIWFRNLRYFVLVNANRPNLWNILKTFLFLIGAFWTIIEFLSFILEGIPTSVENETYKDILRSWVSNYLWWELGSLLLIAAYYNRTKLINRISINDGDLEIECKFCDLFDQEGAIVIPIMDTFDTSFDNNLVDSNTLHGQLIQKYYKDKVHVLDSEITNSLTRTNQSPVSTDLDLKGKKDKYSVGSTAVVEPENKYFYLTVLTTMTSTGNVTIQSESLVDFLAILWQFIPTYGKYSKTINIPLIGKGINRLPPEYTHQRIAQEIANSFITNCKQGTFCSRLRICIYPSDSKFINTDKIQNYVSHLVKYEFNA